MTASLIAIRRASSADAAVIGRLLHDFNTEYDEPTPGAAALTTRIGELLEGDETFALVCGDPIDGLAVARLRPSIWSRALECYLAELYVVPARRGGGRGRALMEAAIEHARAAGADHIDLGTSEDDVAARALYESLGFTNRERGGEGPLSLYYEREL